MLMIVRVPNFSSLSFLIMLWEETAEKLRHLAFKKLALTIPYCPKTVNKTEVTLVDVNSLQRSL